MSQSRAKKQSTRKKGKGASKERKAPKSKATKPVDTSHQQGHQAAHSNPLGGLSRNYGGARHTPVGRKK